YQTKRFTFCVVFKLSEAHGPAHVAARLDKAGLNFIDGSFFQCLFDPLPYYVAVLRMHEVCERFEFPVKALHPTNSVALGRPKDGVGSHIPFPDTHLCCGQCQCEPFFTVTQSLLRHLALGDCPGDISQEGDDLDILFVVILKFVPKTQYSHGSARSYNGCDKLADDGGVSFMHPFGMRQYCVIITDYRPSFVYTVHPYTRLVDGVMLFRLFRLAAFIGCSE